MLASTSICSCECLPCEEHDSETFLVQHIFFKIQIGDVHEIPGVVDSYWFEVSLNLSWCYAFRGFYLREETCWNSEFQGGRLNYEEDCQEASEGATIHCLGFFEGGGRGWKAKIDSWLLLVLILII